MTLALSSLSIKRLRAVSNFLLRRPKNLRLRTKLLLSFVSLTAGLTFVTLMVVRHNAETQTQQHIEQDAQRATLTFEALLRQQQMALNRKADLLASLAFMRNGDATAIEEAGNDPWQSEDCNLFVLTDRNGKIGALHSTGPVFPNSAAQIMLWRSLSRKETSGWWSSGKDLYQVAVQPFYESESTRQNLQGYVVVGRLIDQRAVRELGKFTNSDVVFRYGDELNVDTLAPLKEKAFVNRVRHHGGATQVDLDGEQFFANAIELTPGMFPAANLIVLESYNEVSAYLKRLNQLLLGLGLVTIFAGGALIFLISDTVTRPVVSLMRGVQALERGDFSFALQTAGSDEIATLTRAFDSMRRTLQKQETQREQLESQLRQSQKMEALGRLAGGVAHDFNNLLTVISGHSELLLDRVQPGEPLHNHSVQIRKTADRAASLTRQLLAFSRRQVLQPRVLDVNDLIADMGKLLRRLIREDIELNLQLGDSLAHVKADSGQLEQALLNLAVNAADAMPLGGKVTIETQNIVVDSKTAITRPTIEPGAYVLVSVTDIGVGMDEETKARIFEPFFTTKELGKGTGLGLATVYGVVKQSGGFIWVESAPGIGTRFELYFPRTEEKVETNLSEPVGHSKAPVGQRKTVLVVEDEREVRELACEFLSAAGYSVLSAQDGEEALATAELLGKSIQAVLTDVVMPRMRGPELALRCRTVLPHAKIIYMTGYLEQNGEGAEFPENAHILQKPFSRDSLVRQMNQALSNELSDRLQPHTIVR